MSEISPEEPSMQQHRRRIVYPLLPIYHHKNIRHSAVSWTHNEPYCPLRCCQMYHTEPGSGNTNKKIFNVINHLHRESKKRRRYTLVHIFAKY